MKKETYTAPKLEEMKETILENVYADMSGGSEIGGGNSGDAGDIPFPFGRFWTLKK